MSLPLFDSPLIDQALQQKALLIHDRLCAVYGCPIAYFHTLDPLSELVSALLSHRTRNAQSHQSFQQLIQKFPTWEAVRDAPTDAVQQAIAPSTYAEVKAPRIQQVLRLIEQRHGALSLEFLADLPVPEARSWLEALPGVGPKTSAAVLSFSRLRQRALAVDSHHHRVAIRTGLIPVNTEVGRSHALLEAQLPEAWNAQQVYDNHEVMMLHGQKCCHYRNPDCDRCTILDLCPFGQNRLSTQPRISANEPL